MKRIILIALSICALAQAESVKFTTTSPSWGHDTENGGTVRVGLQLQGSPAALQGTIAYITLSGTAIPGTHYEVWGYNAPEPTNLYKQTIWNGPNNTKELRVHAARYDNHYIEFRFYNDNINSGDRTIDLEIRDPAPSASWERLKTIKIDDDDAPRAHLENISSRTRVGTGYEQQIAGFTISGSGTKTVLVRALGPSLAAYGVPNTLPDPKIQLIQVGGGVNTTNDNWGSASNSSAISATGYAPPNSNEPAILLNLPAGAYTALVSGVGTTNGNAIVEVYDLSGAGTSSQPQSKITNLSTRSYTGTGFEITIAGFVVKNGARNLLIRGLGPTLAQYGIPNTLSDPILEIYNSAGALVASNDNWDPNNTPHYPPPNSAEPAIWLPNLPAGVYTAQLKGKNNTTGISIVEIYEMQ